MTVTTETGATLGPQKREKFEKAFAALYGAACNFCRDDAHGYDDDRIAAAFDGWNLAIAMLEGRHSHLKAPPFEQDSDG